MNNEKFWKELQECKNDIDRNLNLLCLMIANILVISGTLICGIALENIFTIVICSLGIGLSIIGLFEVIRNLVKAHGEQKAILNEIDKEIEKSLKNLYEEMIYNKISNKMQQSLEEIENLTKTLE